MVPHKVLESRLATAAALVGCIAIAHPSFVRPAVAQDTEGEPFIQVAPDYMGVTQPWDVAEAEAKVRSQFLLFGEGDRAWTSLRMVGDNRMYSTNTGIGDDRNLFAATVCQFGTDWSTGCYFQTFGIPAFFAFVALRLPLQAMSQTRAILVTVAGANLANLLLNWLLIFGNWGFRPIWPPSRHQPEFVVRHRPCPATSSTPGRADCCR